MNPEPDRPDEIPADQDANETDAKMDSAGNDDTDAESSEATAGLDPLAQDLVFARLLDFAAPLLLLGAAWRFLLPRPEARVREWVTKARREIGCR